MPGITATDLTMIDEEPRVLDVTLADRLGFERPRDIRKILARNMPELEGFGAPARRANEVSSGRGRKTTVTEFYLNEPQALLICMFSRTPKAAEVRRQVIDVFMQWRAERITTPAVVPLASRSQISRTSPAHDFLSDLASALDRATVHPILGREPFAATSAIFLLRLALADRLGTKPPRPVTDVQGGSYGALLFMDIAALAGFYDLRRHEFDEACREYDANVDEPSAWLLETSVHARLSDMEAIRAEIAARSPSNEDDRRSRSRVILDLATVKDEDPKETLRLIHCE